MLIFSQSFPLCSKGVFSDVVLLISQPHSFCNESPTCHYHIRIPVAKSPFVHSSIRPPLGLLPFIVRRRRRIRHFKERKKEKGKCGFSLSLLALNISASSNSIWRVKSCFLLGARRPSSVSAGGNDGYGTKHHFGSPTSPSHILQHFPVGWMMLCFPLCFPKSFLSSFCLW